MQRHWLEMRRLFRVTDFILRNWSGNVLGFHGVVLGFTQQGVAMLAWKSGLKSTKWAIIDDSNVGRFSSLLKTIEMIFSFSTIAVEIKIKSEPTSWMRRCNFSGRPIRFIALIVSSFLSSDIVSFSSVLSLASEQNGGSATEREEKGAMAAGSAKKRPARLMTSPRSIRSSKRGISVIRHRNPLSPPPPSRFPKVFPFTIFRCTFASLWDTFSHLFWCILLFVPVGLSVGQFVSCSRFCRDCH